MINDYSDVRKFCLISVNYLLLTDYKNYFKMKLRKITSKTFDRNLKYSSTTK